MASKKSSSLIKKSKKNCSKPILTVEPDDELLMSPTRITCKTSLNESVPEIQDFQTAIGNCSKQSFADLMLKYEKAQAKGAELCFKNSKMEQNMTLQEGKIKELEDCLKQQKRRDSYQELITEMEWETKVLEVETEKDSITKELQEKVKELQMENESLKKKITSREESSRSSRRVIIPSSKLASADQVKSSKILIKLNNENYELKKSLKELNISMEKICKEKELTMKNAIKAEEDLTKQVEELQKTIEAQRRDIGVLQNKDESIQEIKKKDVENLQTERAELFQTTHKLEKQVESMIREQQGLEARLQSTLNDREQEIKKLKKIEEECLTMKKDLQSEIRIKENFQMQLKDQLNTNQRLEILTKDREKRILELEKKLKESEGKIKTKEDELIMKMDKIKHLECDNKEMLIKISTLDKEKEVHNEEKNALVELQNKGEDKIKLLEREIEKVVGAEESLQKEVVALRRENFAKNAILGNIKVKMSEFESRWRVAEESNDILKGQLEVAEKEKYLAEETTKVIRINVESLMEEKKRLTEDNLMMADLQKKYRKLKETLNRYVEKHRYCKDKHQMLEKSFEKQQDRERHRSSSEELRSKQTSPDSLELPNENSNNDDMPSCIEKDEDISAILDKVRPVFKALKKISAEDRKSQDCQALSSDFLSSVSKSGSSQSIRANNQCENTSHANSSKPEGSLEDQSKDQSEATAINQSHTDSLRPEQSGVGDNVAMETQGGHCAVHQDEPQPPVLLQLSSEIQETSGLRQLHSYQPGYSAHAQFGAGYLHPGDQQGYLTEKEILGARFREADGMVQAWLQRMENEKRQSRSRHPSVEEIQPLSKRRSSDENEAIVILSDTRRRSNDSSRKQAHSSRRHGHSSRRRRDRKSRSSSVVSSHSSRSRSRSRSRSKSKKKHRHRTRRHHSSDRSSRRRRSRTKRRRSDSSISRGKRSRTSKTPSRRTNRTNDVVEIRDDSSPDEVIALNDTSASTVSRSYMDSSSSHNSSQNPISSNISQLNSTTSSAAKEEIKDLPVNTGPGLSSADAGDPSHLTVRHILITEGDGKSERIALPIPLPPPPPLPQPDLTKNVSNSPPEHVKQEQKAIKTLEMSASTVQWKDFCDTCGIRVHDIGHYDTRGLCKRKISFEKKGYKLICKYCNDTSHWIDACSYLCSFCLSCWCWGHTDECHKKFGEEFVKSLLSTYTEMRCSFHPQAKDHALPNNLLTKTGCRYPGTKKDLIIIAQKLESEGTFQPWLNANWDKSG